MIGRPGQGDRLRLGDDLVLIFFCSESPGDSKFQRTRNYQTHDPTDSKIYERGKRIGLAGKRRSPQE